MEQELYQERVATALEAIAKSLCLLTEKILSEVGEYEQIRKERNPAEGKSDRAKPVLQSDREIFESRNCAQPEYRHGYNFEKAKAVCGFMCPDWQTCPIPHKPIDDPKGQERRTPEED